MLSAEVLLFWLILAAVVFAVWHWVLKPRISQDARERRRRRRNYGRTTSRRHGPTVKLAAKVKRP